MNLIELIPSADVREHIRRAGRTFNDSDRAAILYRLHGHTLAEKTAWLRELGGQTQNPVLAKQIAQPTSMRASRWSSLQGKGAFPMSTSARCTWSDAGRKRKIRTVISWSPGV